MGVSGFQNTENELNNANIIFFGAGDNSEDALKPLLLDKIGIKLIIFSGFEFRPNYDTLYHFYANNTSAGVNLLDTFRLNIQISLYRKNYPGSVIVIFPHWGKNYGEVTEKQTAFAHSWINAGADAVIGHGSHTVQPIEKYNDKYIFYSIGNFIFNAPGRYSSTDSKPYGIMLEMILSDSRAKFELFPVFTNNKLNNYHLRLLNEDELDDFENEYLYSILNYKKSSNGTFILDH